MVYKLRRIESETYHNLIFVVVVKEFFSDSRCDLKLRELGLAFSHCHGVFNSADNIEFRIVDRQFEPLDNNFGIRFMFDVLLVISDSIIPDFSVRHIEITEIVRRGQFLKRHSCRREGLHTGNIGTRPAYLRRPLRIAGKVRHSLRFGHITE